MSKKLLTSFTVLTVLLHTATVAAARDLSLLAAPAVGTEYVRIPYAVMQDTPQGVPVRLSLPVIRDERVYGDTLVDLYPGGEVRLDRDSLLLRLAPFIVESARSDFARRLGEAENLTIEQVAQAGIGLRYDAGLLELYVDRVDAAFTPLVSLGTGGRSDNPPLTLWPEPFSAYLNVVGDFRYAAGQDTQDPGALLNGAIRYRGVVLEFDGGYGGSGVDRGFYRQSVRLVYDQPESLRRWSAGDLQLDGLGLSGGALMGGIGVEKGRRNFFYTPAITSIGQRQILLERDSTVEILVDGQQVQTLQLTAGPYDLGQLRADYSGRNAQLFITDFTGRRQLADFETYFDAGDLAEGEVEYSAGVGLLSTGFGAQSNYDGPAAFSGYFRRGMTDRLALGGSLQASERIQVVGVELLAASQFFPGRLELSGAVSNGEAGSGYAVRGAYAIQFGELNERQVSFTADYRDAHFIALGDQLGLPNAETFNANVNYSQSISDNTYVTAGATVFQRSGFDTIQSAYVDLSHRTQRFRITAGVEYNSRASQENYGFRVGLSMPLGRTTRAEATYNGSREEYRAIVSRSYDEQVGSWGYDLGVRQAPNTASVDGSGTYVGNRVFARAVASSSGSGLGQVGDRQQASLQLGSSIAFAGGAFAIGRPIQDSFVIATPHVAMANERVVIGRSIHDERYDATSGSLGPALSSSLISYSRQGIFYDLVGGARGADIGSGAETLEPPYRSGYRLIVGTGATVTAVGYLNLDGARAELVSGTISSPDDAEFQQQPFFTNSIGRFAIVGLRPNATYEVRLFETGLVYKFKVPQDSESILQMGDIMLMQATEEEGSPQ